MKNQSGRSMVEMLAVLAMVGVLSVITVWGIRYAFKKQKANELLNEVSKRAVVVAMQAQQDNNVYSVGEFTNPEGYVFGAKNWNQTQFAITLTTSDNKVIESEICQNMKNTVGGQSFLRQIGRDCFHFIFNNDLTINDTVTEKPCTDDTQCNGCQKCSEEGYCVEKCLPTQSCGAGSGNVGYVCLDVPSVCGSCTPNQWCKITSSSCQSQGGGSCVDIENEVKFETRKVDWPLPQGGTVSIYIGPGNISWWAAKNFCEAHGRKMAQVSTLGLKKQSCTSECKDRQGNLITSEYQTTLLQKVANTWYWLADIGSTCGSYAIFPKYSGTDFRMSNLGRHYTYTAICE